MAGSLVKTSLLFLAAASLSSASPCKRHKTSSAHGSVATGGASGSSNPPSVPAGTASASGTPAPKYQSGPSPSSSSSNGASNSNNNNNTNAGGNSTTTSSSGSSSGLMPGGKKAGSAGGEAVPFWAKHLGWWYDWTPEPGTNTGVVGVPMLWGDGQNGPQDAKRWAEFSQLKAAPKYLLGFNEPDCSGVDTSAHMTVDKAVQVWNEKIAPWGEKGSLLGSPSMCMQYSETWLKQFSEAKLDRMWDFTAIHVYKKDMAGVKQDIDHYAQYGKPIWVTEFACVDDQNGFVACSNQDEINTWIEDAVDLFQSDDRVLAYGYTDGGGLNDMWLPVNSAGNQLSESGQTYLKAISKYG